MSIATEKVESEQDSSEKKKPQNSRAGQFLKHALVYGVGTLSMQLVSIVLMPLYTNHLTTTEYGLLTTLYRIGDVLNICLMMNGIRQASLNFWCNAKDDKERRTIPPTVSLFTFCILLAGIAFAFAFSGVLSRRFELDAPLLLACGTTAMLLQAFTVMPLALMQARLESTSYVVTTLSILVVQLSLVILGVWGFGWGVWGVVAALIVTYGLFGIGLTAKELWSADLRPNYKQFKEIVKFSAPFVPTGLCFFVLHNGDHFFLLEHHTPAIAGVYGLGYRLAKGIVLMAFQPFIQVWGAWMYDVAKKPKADVVFGQAYTQILAACMWVGITLLIFHKEVLAILSSEEYVDSAKVLGPLVFAHFFWVFCSLLDSAYYVKRRTDLKPWLGLAATVVMLVCYYLLIPKYAAIGAAYATLIGFAIYAVINLVVARRVLSVRFEFSRIAVLFLIAFLVCIGSHPLELGVLSFSLKVLLWCAFPAAIWLVLANAEERETVQMGVAKIRHAIAKRN